MAADRHKITSRKDLTPYDINRRMPPPLNLILNRIEPFAGSDATYIPDVISQSGSGH